MTFKTQMAADLLDMLDTDVFADTVSYNSAPISAVVQVEDSLVVDGKHYKMVERATAFVPASAVPAPAYRDTLVDADGTTWTVAKVIETAGGCHRLLLESGRRHAV